MKHKDGSTDKYKDKHKEKRKEEKVIYHTNNSLCIALFKYMLLS